MNRRRFLPALAGALVGARALPAIAATPMKRIAFFAILDIDDKTNPGEIKEAVDEMIGKPLAELGWRDGVNLQIVPHIVPMLTNWDETLPKMARDVASSNYDGAIAEGENATRALQRAAPKLPIAAYLHDPVGLGFAKSYAKPGGAVTGVHRGSREIFVKQMDILRRLVPGMTRMAWISWPPQVDVTWPAFEWAARESGIAARQVTLKPHAVGDRHEYLNLAADVAALRRDGYPCAWYQGSHDRDLNAVLPLALRHGIALAYGGPPEDLAREGLLLQYRGLRTGVQGRLAAAMARILRGEKPGDIPFEGPTRYSLRLNLKTAARIGVKVPDDVILMMDEVLR